VNFKNLLAITLLIGMVSVAFAEGVKSLQLLQKASPEVEWQSQSKVTADFNCDGKHDVAYLGKTKANFFVSVILGPITKASLISTTTLRNVTSEDAQDSVREENPSLTTESLDYDTVEMFGENPEGFKPSKTCSGLNLSSGETDSFHFYWNHKTNELTWWRL
jgi:hypothetical protein